MYINRGLLKQNARNTLSRGYWSCVLGGLVLALAAGDFGSTPSANTYSFSGMGKNPSGNFRGDIYSYDPADVFGGIFGNADLPLYMLEIFIAVLTIALVISVLITIFLRQPLEVGCRRFFIGARD